MEEIIFKNKVDKIIKETVPKMLSSSAFPQRKLTDTPSDDLQVVNRRFVTLNGLTASRPTSPVTGQNYYDTQIDRPIWWNGSNWKNAAGTTV